MSRKAPNGAPSVCHVLPTPLQVTSGGCTEADSFWLISFPQAVIRNPEQHLALDDPQRNVEGKASDADQRHREERQARVEGIAREHDDLAEPAADASRFR